MLKVPKFTPTVEIHCQLNRPLLETHRKFHCMNEMYKVHYGHSPESVQDMFQKVSEIHGRVTRQAMSDEYYLPSVKVETCKRNFAYRGIILWKEVPLAIRQSKSLNVFKNNR